jgi:release factor glutamine methyltransferase
MTLVPPALEVMEFGSLAIAFDERVLRPRPWTTAQSHWAAELLESAPAGPVLELCAGAGHIGLLAVAGSDRALVCVDVSPVACGHARRNAEANGLGDRVEVREGPMDEVVRDSERFALVVADPPWVRRTEIDRYPDDPVVAIDGGEDGLDLARLCLDVARRHLRPGGTVLLQIGTLDQADALRAELAEDELRLVEVRECERGVVVRLDLA